jgi:hypothetical protein
MSLTLNFLTFFFLMREKIYVTLCPRVLLSIPLRPLVHFQALTDFIKLGINMAPLDGSPFSTFSFLNTMNVHTTKLEATLAPVTFHSEATEVLSHACVAPEVEVDHSRPPSAEVKNNWSYNPIVLIRLHGVDRDNFAFRFF